MPTDDINNVTNAVTDEPAPSPDQTTDDTTVDTAATTDDSATSDDSTTADTTETDTGSEPQQGDSKAVRELKAQRRKRQDAEREAEYWRAVAEGRIKAPAQETQQAPVDANAEPVVTNYPDYESYLIAKAKFELKREQESTATQTQAQQIHGTFISKLNEAADANPDEDIMEMATQLGTKVSPALGWIIKETEAPVAVVKYLYDHPAEVTKLNNMSPTAAARAVGMLEFKLTNPPKVETKKVSNAPNPVTPVKPTGSVEYDEDKASMEEFHKRRQQERSAHSRR